MRGRTNIAALMAIAMIAGTYTGSPPILRDGTRRRREGEHDEKPDEKPDGPDLTTRDLLELDLYRAQERLAEARTPGAQRKARRRVDAIRARLAPAGGEGR